MKHALIGAVVSLVAVCGVAVAGPHPVSYSQVSVAPGTRVTIGEQQYVAVQAGVREFTRDKRYAVRFLADYEGDSFRTHLRVRHSAEPLPNPNATIDGFPAQIEIIDERLYEWEGDGFDQQSTLQVTAEASAVVQIEIEDTIVILYADPYRIDRSVHLTGDEMYRATSQYQCGNCTDPLTLVGPGGLDKWVDYIRVIPLN